MKESYRVEDKISSDEEQRTLTTRFDTVQKISIQNCDSVSENYGYIETYSIENLNDKG